MAKHRWNFRIPKKLLGIKLPEVAPDAKIIAKKELWDFLHEARFEIIEWEDSDEDFARQFIPYIIHILHPHFTGIEMEREIRNVYTTLNRPIPRDYIAIFTDCFTQHMRAKFNRMFGDKE